MSDEILCFRTCKSCGHDNADNARKCNSCASSMFIGIFETANFHERWGCPKCSTLNMKENEKCRCGFKRPSNCFITSACVSFAGLPDDCSTLMAMRQLRDSYVANLPNGDALIAEYYSVAPKIVAAIECHPQKEDFYNDIYMELLQIEAEVSSENAAKAKAMYERLYAKLRIQLLGDV